MQLASNVYISEIISDTSDALPPPNVVDLARIVVGAPLNWKLGFG